MSKFENLKKFENDFAQVLADNVSGRVQLNRFDPLRGPVHSQVGGGLGLPIPQRVVGSPAEQAVRLDPHLDSAAGEVVDKLLLYRNNSVIGQEARQDMPRPPPHNPLDQTALLI